jgi:TetR/AcrR family transcriptional regulator, transcriptional repressor for nem operon
MDAAQELIWSTSYGAVTIEAICKRARVRTRTFYDLFDSQSDLVQSAIRVWWDERKKMMEGLIRPGAPSLEHIWKYLDIVTRDQLEAYEKNGEILGCPLFTLGSEICKLDEEIKSLLQEILGFVGRYFEEALRRAQACGELSGNDSALKGRLLWAFYEGTLTRARIKNNPELVRNLSADARTLIYAPFPALPSHSPEQFEAAFKYGASASGLATQGSPEERSQRSNLAEPALRKKMFPLSKRQSLALNFLILGRPHKEIASSMNVSPHTLHGYIKVIYRHFNVHSQAELMNRVYEGHGYKLN